MRGPWMRGRLPPLPCADFIPRSKRKRELVKTLDETSFAKGIQLEVEDVPLRRMHLLGLHIDAQCEALLHCH